MEIINKYKITICIVSVLVVLLITNILTYHYASSNVSETTTAVVSDTLYVKDSTAIRLLKDSLNYFHSINTDAKVKIVYKHDTLGNTEITYDSSGTMADTSTLVLTRLDSIYVHDTVYIKDSINASTIIKKETKFNADINTYINASDEIDFSYGAQATFKYKIFTPVYIGMSIKKENLTDIKNWNGYILMGLNFNF